MTSCFSLSVRRISLSLLLSLSSSREVKRDISLFLFSPSGAILSFFSTFSHSLFLTTRWKPRGISVDWVVPSRASTSFLFTAKDKRMGEHRHGGMMINPRISPSSRAFSYRSFPSLVSSLAPLSPALLPFFIFFFFTWTPTNERVQSKWLISR